ncbi:hypothetical protein FISHEDRAFT_76447 [Fistulina hepatica ATCC 64428]|uniref:Uncharacterized protein n=1 Tax=Fistulina hepatica ATCC 64428 TaxID=1128425 RepID=A0A0D7A4D6_9AGAR|nr:hypothetical protein FISHEDRAFT_76447 [Fistulina hepatica ATCC 64428]
MVEHDATTAFCGRPRSERAQRPQDVVVGLKNKRTAAKRGRQCRRRRDDRILRPSTSTMSPTATRGGRWVQGGDDGRSTQPSRWKGRRRCRVQRRSGGAPRGPRSAVLEGKKTTTAAQGSGGVVEHLKDHRMRSSRAERPPPLHKAAVEQWTTSGTAERGPRGWKGRHRCTRQRWTTCCGRRCRDEAQRPQCGRWAQDKGDSRIARPSKSKTT